MFLGQWNHSHAVGYLPLGSTAGRKKIKIWVVRERYGDCAAVSVEIRLFRGRNKEPFLVHEIPLGNVNKAPFKERLIVDEGDYNSNLIQNPVIVRELEKIVKALGKYASERAKNGLPLETLEFDRICESICLRPLQVLKAA